jgi:hypothetical protein
LSQHFSLLAYSGMLRIQFVDQNDPKDPGTQSDQLTQEIAAGNYNLDIELDAAQLGLGPASKKVIRALPPFHLSPTHFDTSGGRCGELSVDRPALRGRMRVREALVPHFGREQLPVQCYQKQVKWKRAAPASWASNLHV